MSRVAGLVLFGCLLGAGCPAEAARLKHAASRQTMSFTPGDRARMNAAPNPPRVPLAANRVTARGRFAKGNPHEEGRASATSAPPGSGFKMEDGVLTYPAPARFQPKNLKPL